MKKYWSGMRARAQKILERADARAAQVLTELVPEFFEKKAALKPVRIDKCRKLRRDEIREINERSEW